MLEHQRMHLDGVNGKVEKNSCSSSSKYLLSDVCLTILVYCKQDMSQLHDAYPKRNAPSIQDICGKLFGNTGHTFFTSKSDSETVCDSPLPQTCIHTPNSDTYLK